MPGTPGCVPVCQRRLPYRMSDAESSDTVRTVYELREAAVNYGRALAAADLVPSPTTRDRVLDTKTELEERTVAAIDECTDEPERDVA